MPQGRTVPCLRTFGARITDTARSAAPGGLYHVLASGQTQVKPRTMNTTKDSAAVWRGLESRWRHLAKLESDTGLRSDAENMAEQASRAAGRVRRMAEADN